MNKQHRKRIRLAILKEFDSQINFAGVVGMHDTFVSMVLRGHRKLNPEDSARWQSALKCNSRLLKPVTRKQ